MGQNSHPCQFWLRAALATMWCLTAVAGCRRAVAPPAPVPATPQVPTARPVPATQPIALLTGGETAGLPLVQPTTVARGEQTFENQAAGIRFHYAGDWIEQKSPDDLLMLVPVNGPNSRTI